MPPVGEDRPDARATPPGRRFAVSEAADELEKMSPEQANSNWDRVRAFLAGERG